MTVRITFGIVTAKESPAAVLQLIDLIGPQHRVVIHHDFSKQIFAFAGPRYASSKIHE